MREVHKEGAKVTRGEAGPSNPLGVEERLSYAARRGPELFSPAWSIALVAADLVLFCLSAYAGIAMVHHNSSLHFVLFSRYADTSMIFIAVWLAIFERFGLYKRSFALSMRDEVYYVCAALTVGILPLLIAFTIYPHISTSRVSLLVSLVLSFAMVSTSRAFFHYVRSTVRARERKIAIVGARKRIDSVMRSLQLPDPEHVVRLEIEEIESTLAEVASPNALQGCVQRVTWIAQALATGCSRIILTEIVPPQCLPRLMSEAAFHGLTIEFALPRLVSHAFSLNLRVEGSQALIVPVPLRACTPTALLAKRIFDLAVSGIALLFASPIMLLAALAIWLEDRGPILYRQTRVGRNGSTFEMLKFRSMRPDAEARSGPTWVRAQDDRITRVGALLRRTSIDELPQLLNVLRGDMSIVGPRPERPVFVNEFRLRLQRYDERHLVRPGITGWSQMQMRRQLEMSDIDEKLTLDLFYLENWSLSLDLSLLIKTGFEFLFQNAR